MKDCSSCQYSVENRPELRGIDYEKLPCASCDASVPSCGDMVLGDQFENPSSGTLKIEVEPERGNLSDLGYMYSRYLRYSSERRGKIRMFLVKRKLPCSGVRTLMGHFTKNQENVLTEFAAENWQVSQSEVARRLGVSKQYLNKFLKAIVAEQPAYGGILTGERNGK